MKLTVCSIALAGALLAAPPVRGQSVAPVALDSVSVLHPGDVLKITVWRNQELSGDIPVGATGALVHPLYQDVIVAGVPLATVERNLKQFLARFESNPQVVVVPLFRVTVGGEVRIPNLYTLPRETSISQAVAQAGGTTERGRLDRVKLLRGGQEIMLDLTRPDGAWANAPIESGDQILVGRRGNFITSVFVPIVSTAGAIAAIINVIRR